jgi:methionine transaminase
MQIHSKLPAVGTTIFTVMTKLANESGAINLSQGFPDFDVDPALIDLVHRHMRGGRNQYAPMQGVPVLRERIAEKVRETYGASCDPDTEITVTSGGTEALFAAITAVVGHGDQAVLFEPAYDSYAPAIELCGGIPVFCPMRFPDYSIDWDRVKDSITQKTKLLILNSPHNPSGAVLSVRDIAALTDIVANTGIFIVSDEVYEHIIFDGLRHESMARYPELARRSFVVSSFGKTYHATGWKVGYCFAPAALSAEFRKIHQYLTFATNTPVQMALADFMEQKEKYRSLPAFYQAKRDLFLSLIKGSRFRCLPSRGTYFQMLDYSAITDEPDTAFARRMTVEHGVAAIPPSVFYHDGADNRVLRFCFAKREETLAAAAERLCGI